MCTIRVTGNWIRPHLNNSNTFLTLCPLALATSAVLIFASSHCLDSEGDAGGGALSDYHCRSFVSNSAWGARENVEWDHAFPPGACSSSLLPFIDHLSAFFATDCLLHSLCFPSLLLFQFLSLFLFCFSSPFVVWMCTCRGKLWMLFSPHTLFEAVSLLVCWCKCWASRPWESCLLVGALALQRFELQIWFYVDAGDSNSGL